jgi:phosphoribosylformimino-5-aminoimidazole carboxamide ribotide isomerase
MGPFSTNLAALRELAESVEIPVDRLRGISSLTGLTEFIVFGTFGSNGSNRGRCLYTWCS